MSDLKYKPLVPSRVRYLVLHKTGDEREDADSAAMIDRIHRKRGLLSIGYHFVIKRDGTVEPGRSLERPGAHARGFNQFSVGVCLICPAGEATTVEQSMSVVKLANDLALNYPGITTINVADLTKRTVH